MIWDYKWCKFIETKSGYLMTFENEQSAIDFIKSKSKYYTTTSIEYIKPVAVIDGNCDFSLN